MYATGIPGAQRPADKPGNECSLSVEFGQNLLKRLGIRGVHIAQRGAHLRRPDDARANEGPLDRHGIRLDEERLERWIELAMNSRGPGKIIGQRQFHHLADFSNIEVGRDADHPFRTDRHEGQGEGIVTT